MATIQCTHIKTKQELSAFAEVQFKVFGRLTRTSSHVRPVAQRIIRGIDLLDTTINFRTHLGDQTLGGAGLYLPNPEVAGANETTLGLPLEQYYRIDHGPGPGVLPAEVSRLCILPEWHGSRALPVLFAEIIAECLDLGISHILGSTNLETSSPEDAAIAYGIACHLGLASPDWRAEPRKPSAPVPPRRPSQYSLPQRLRALRGDFSGLELPRTLALLVKLVGARIWGEPAYDTYMRRYAMPIVISLDNISSTPMQRFLPSRRRRRPQRSAQPAAAQDRSREGIISRLHGVVDKLEASLDALPRARRLQEGRPSRAEYIWFLTQTYQYTRTTRRFLAMAARRMKRLGQNPALAALLARKAKQEAGHHRWALSNIRAMGGSVQAAIKKRHSAAVALYIAWNLFLILSDTPAGFLGTAFVLEALSIRRGARAVHNLRERSSLHQKALTFLDMHSTADDLHLAELEEQLRVLNEREQEMALFSAQVTALAYAGLFTSRPA